MHKLLHAGDSVDRLYASRKDGGRECASIEDNVDVSKRLNDYIENSGRRLFTVIRNNTDNTKNNRTKITRKLKKMKEKDLSEYFKGLTNDISHEKKYLDVT